MTTILSIDPGKSGAACLMHRGKVAGAWAWRPYALKKNTRQWYITDVHGEEMIACSLHEVGDLIACWAFDLGFNDWTLVVEGLFCRGVKSAMTLAESTALVYGPMTVYASNERSPVRVLASTWRPAVLGCAGGASSDEAERLAMALCAARWPELGELLANPHCCEAVAIGWWQHTQQRRESAGEGR